MGGRGTAHRVALVLLVALAAVSFVLVVPPTPASAANCPTVCPGPGGPGEPDGGDGSFSGSVLVSEDGEVAEAPSTDGGSCEDCYWRLKPSCELGGLHLCRETMRCTDEDDPRPEMRTVYDVMFRQGDSEWERISSFCMEDESDAHDAADVGEEVRENWIAYVPELNPSAQPVKGKTLVGLDTIFHSGQPREMPEKTVPVYNFEIRLTATGRWFWTFEPGVSDVFDIPGSYHPDTAVSHVYLETGDYQPSVRTEWYGTFWVGDDGPFDIPEPATQGPEELPMRVVESSPVLTR